ncbi:hypothetical protein B0H11DRAFT_1914599 [Mycena galericulata]|nr:hypothetical protein B0H11DRAFT_1914599 [Mycena galericulata]
MSQPEFPGTFSPVSKGMINPGLLHHIIGLLNEYPLGHRVVYEQCGQNLAYFLGCLTLCGFGDHRLCAFFGFTDFARFDDRGLCAEFDLRDCAIGRIRAIQCGNMISGCVIRSPLLHSLDLYSDEGTSTSPLPRSSFPWSQLTHMRIHMGINLAETLDILVQCRQLESAHISLSKGPGRVQELQPTATLPNLRELYYAVPYIDASSAALLETFSFPNLETLSLDRVDDFTVEQLLLFIQSQPILETLSLVNCTVCDHPELFRLFTHPPTPALTALSKLVVGLNFRRDGAAVADMAEILSGYMGENSPFPRLDTLYLMTHPLQPKAQHEDEVEARLRAVAATGFLIREVTPDPGDITEYIKIDGEAWR